MTWEKLGRVFDPKDVLESDWWVSHACLPTPHVLSDRIRVYVAAWDADQRGRVAYVDLDIDEPTDMLGVSDEPALDLGAPGAFDEHGVNPSSILVWNGKLYLYYIGWQRLDGVPYTLFSGLARAPGGVEGREFVRCSEAPLLDRQHDERYVRTAPVAKRVGHSVRLWYASGNEWIETGGKPMPTYGLHMMDMPTPMQVPSTSTEVLSPWIDEIGIGRPAIDFDSETARWRAWYPSRTLEGYRRISYAEASQFDPRFERVNDSSMTIETSDEGWDSEMVCFPALVDVDAGRFMLYNGNGYGETGFGIARWSE